MSAKKNNTSCAITFIFLILLGCSMPVLSHEVGDTILRLGYANVDFREDSDPVLVDNAMELGYLSVESHRAPLLTVATMFTERWGVEAIIPFLPLELEADGKGGLIDGLPMGSADFWPLTITFQYYPFETQRLMPYVGIGANYTFITNERIDRSTASLLGVEQILSVDADDSIGMVLQAGVDFPVTENLMINVSTTYLELSLDATSTVYANGALSTLSAKVDVERQPNITVVGFSYKF